MTVVAIDAYPVQPINVSSIDLHSGQRVDVLINMNQNISESYWISVTIRSREAVRYGAAIIKYDNAVNNPSQTRYDELVATQPNWDDYNYTRNQENNYVGLSDPPSNINKRWMLLTTQEQYNLDDGIHFHGDELINLNKYVFPWTTLNSS